MVMVTTLDGERLMVMPVVGGEATVMPQFGGVENDVAQIDEQDDGGDQW